MFFFFQVTEKKIQVKGGMIINQTWLFVDNLQVAPLGIEIGPSRTQKWVPSIAIRIYKMQLVWKSYPLSPFILYILTCWDCKSCIFWHTSVSMDAMPNFH